jgi:hypothetical protein
MDKNKTRKVICTPLVVKKSYVMLQIIVRKEIQFDDIID